MLMIVLGKLAAVEYIWWSDRQTEEMSEAASKQVFGFNNVRGVAFSAAPHVCMVFDQPHVGRHRMRVLID